MTLHFNETMLIGLAMLPGGLVIGLLLAMFLAWRGHEIGSLAGFVPGVIVGICGAAVFFVGLGQELH